MSYGSSALLCTCRWAPRCQASPGLPELFSSCSSPGHPWDFKAGQRITDSCLNSQLTRNSQGSRDISLCPEQGSIDFCQILPVPRRGSHRKRTIHHRKQRRLLWLTKRRLLGVTLAVSFFKPFILKVLYRATGTPWSLGSANQTQQPWGSSACGTSYSHGSGSEFGWLILSHWGDIITQMLTWELWGEKKIKFTTVQEKQAVVWNVH